MNHNNVAPRDLWHSKCIIKYKNAHNGKILTKYGDDTNGSNE